MGWCGAGCRNGIAAAWFSGLEIIAANWTQWLRLLLDSFQEMADRIRETFTQLVAFVSGQFVALARAAESVRNLDFRSAIAQIAGAAVAPGGLNFPSLDGIADEMFGDIQGKAKEARDELRSLVEDYRRRVSQQQEATNDIVQPAVASAGGDGLFGFGDFLRNTASGASSLFARLQAIQDGQLQDNAAELRQRQVTASGTFFGGAASLLGSGASPEVLATNRVVDEVKAQRLQQRAMQRDAKKQIKVAEQIRDELQAQDDPFI